jgi:chromosome segregation ATPase
VNLAASQEYEEVSQRFDELSHQMQDLQNTVDQLKDAMKSIDQETRKLFMTTLIRSIKNYNCCFQRYLVVVKRL